MSTPAFYDELRALRLERVLDASVAIITEEGWDRLSMTKVAQRSGVPRQSLYKEVGTKSELGEAVVHREVDRFLAGVRDGLAAHPGDTVEGLGAAARFALEYGETNDVLKAILRPGHDPELLELLTVRPEAVLAQATQAIGEALGDASEAMVDTMVRLTMSHVLQPTVGIDEAVDRIKRTIHGFIAG
ncbi:TetR family transcriptional regulator [Nocardioides marmorisolisilvae]|uniref:TetR/AcrR family transcriptional regulator n=1 Tax=Nocardioides marmorisolisilvae TaxID=1542737 RepID=A0A3N0DVC5_9ACTN|nr:TetR family transcriptional regulator [Nocardioides marmorisolisilvae]RNL79574.1 TetR/AcrR family transcriptional regulator [Nocardioides marmorisolisilvae]